MTAPLETKTIITGKDLDCPVVCPKGWKCSVVSGHGEARCNYFLDLFDKRTGTRIRDCLRRDMET